MKLEENIQEVLVSEEQLKKRIAEMAADITRDYAGKKPLMVGILRGSVIFMADLVRQIDLPISMDFMVVSSYGAGTVSSGLVNIKKDLEEDIKGRDVIIVEDIVDTGLTMKRMIETLGTRNPASVSICSLLVKPDKLKVDLDLKYVAFRIPNQFILGYGLDYDQQGRGLKDIYTICE